MPANFFSRKISSNASISVSKEFFDVRLAPGGA
jgi:hypothetical protein